MKLIVIMSAIFLTTANEEKANLFSKDSLENKLQEVRENDSTWIEVLLSESIENQIVQEMIQEFPWSERITDYKPLTFQECRHLVRELGFTILHTEVHRNFIQEPRLEWVSALGLNEVETQLFLKEFFARFEETEGKIHKHLLMHVRKSGSLQSGQS